MIAQFALLLVLLWPLLLACALLLPHTRHAAQRLAPWAALPALLFALPMDDTMAHLYWTLLGAALHFDAGGRALLLLSATLALAAGLLARGQPVAQKNVRQALLLLLATTAALTLAVAGDGVLFFTTSTLLGYALYGLMATTSSADTRTARAFIVMLVVSDLVVFELLLVLAHDSGGLVFDSLRQALQVADFPVATLVLLLTGFGLKAGLIGLHLWLAPAFVGAAAPLRPLLLIFIFCAGWAGWLRLLPLGQVHWPDGGAALQWLGVATLAYAVAVGLLQHQWRSALAYVAMGLGGLLLWLLGTVLAAPEMWTAIFSALLLALPQAAFALAELTLLPRVYRMTPSSWVARGLVAAPWLAAALLLAAPLQVVAALGSVVPATALHFAWLVALFTLLVIGSLRLPRSTAVPGNPVVVAGLMLAALLLIPGLFTAPVTLVQGQALLLVLVAAGIGWIGSVGLRERLPEIPPGDLLGMLERTLLALVAASIRLGRQLGHGRDRLLAALRYLLGHLPWGMISDRLEAQLGRWPLAMLLLVLLGLTLGGWGIVG